VMEVDLPRKRIALSMRLDDVPGEARTSTSRGDRPARDDRGGRGTLRPLPAKKPEPVVANSAFADAFSCARKR